MLSPFLPNGLALDRPLPQVLEAQQHGEHLFELAVEMDLIAAEPFQLVCVERLAECRGSGAGSPFPSWGSRTMTAPRLRGSTAGHRHRRWRTPRPSPVRQGRWSACLEGIGPLPRLVCASQRLLARSGSASP
jgi:hypothetical protein